MFVLSSTWQRIAMALAALVCLAAPPVSAQSTGSIRGRVLDAATQRPIGEVQVGIAGSRIGTVSNAAGEYTLVNVPAATVADRLTGV